MVVWEGTRPLLVELQALVDETQLANPRRVTVGTEQNRLAMLLAVLHRHAGVAMGGFDVFINVVGGVKVEETAADVPVAMALLSSYRGSPIPKDMIAFGEIGLSERSGLFHRGRSALPRLRSTASGLRSCRRPTRRESR